MGLPLYSEIAVVFVGALAFGLYFATLLTCIRWLLFVDEGWRLRKTIRWTILSVTFFIFGFNVAYLGWSLHWSMIKAWHAINDPPGATYTTPEWANIISCTVANCNVLLADVVLIHRCWILYSRRGSVVIVPISLWLGAFLCTILQIYLQAAHIKEPTIGPYSWASVTMTLGPGIVLIPFWICSILLNTYSSIVLIRRMYKTAKESRVFSSVEHFHFLIRIIAESGLLYVSITLAHLLVWFGTDKFAIDIISVLNAPIIGIAFNWFLIRMAKNNAEEAARATVETNVSTIKFGKPPSNAPQDVMRTPDAMNDTTSVGTLISISPDTASESRGSRHSAAHD
ncbi:hypothetical protein P691DRAFT_809931 [Macrolepiota fuliginosa MF-IS2]|uniref:Uncharacterized protein n=1 Tax=Macrolepiota fuliginosa MF-IS2 TaxID=1400762 RepID=A0A9P5XFW1_9AGAR|nr:hypothetical protein P691DRAFT_809931 [Macrolepiota fuliginosa MF-IS2]